MAPRSLAQATGKMKLPLIETAVQVWGKKEFIWGYVKLEMFIQVDMSGC